jgi:hypothetical protein
MFDDDNIDDIYMRVCVHNCDIYIYIYVAHGHRDKPLLFDWVEQNKTNDAPNQCFSRFARYVFHFIFLSGHVDTRFDQTKT